MIDSIEMNGGDDDFFDSSDQNQWDSLNQNQWDSLDWNQIILCGKGINQLESLKFTNSCKVCILLIGF